jgi:hypothetical protein
MQIMAVTEKQLANLKPFTSETAPRNGGRPRRLLLTQEYTDVLKSPAPKEVANELQKWGAKPGDSWARCIALSRARDAIRSSAAATLSAKELADRVEGRPTQRVELSRPDGPPEFIVVYADALPGTKVIDVTPPQVPESAIETTATPSEDSDVAKNES